MYAKWVPVEYSITYNLGGGSNNAENPESYNTESPTITLKDASRFAHNFKGWYTTSTFTGYAVTSIPAGSHGDITLWAKWTPINYTVSINASAPVYTEIPGLSAPVVSGNTISFTAPGNYSEYAWYVDDSDVPLGNSSTLTINLSTTSLKGGYHIMSLEVTASNGSHYSAQYEFSFSK